MKKLMRIFLSALTFLGWFSASARAQAPRKVKMTIPVVAHSMTPVYVAQSKGFFAEEKLEVDITSTGGGGREFSRRDDVVASPGAPERGTFRR
jgi:ABC-type nitrate/sulfonate/bicarbonate transport system substrate-binding protein